MDKDLRSLIRESRLTYDQIAFGCNVSTSWVQKYMGGKITEPGVTRHNKVRDFLLHRIDANRAAKVPKQRRAA